MAKKEVFEMQAEICKALGHPLRIEIIELLTKKELCFGDILEETGGLKSTLSQQLSIMVDKGILKTRKDSRCVYFSLSSSKVSRACDLMRDVLVIRMKKQHKLLKDLGK